MHVGVEPADVVRGDLLARHIPFVVPPHAAVALPGASVLRPLSGLMWTAWVRFQESVECHQEKKLAAKLRIGF